MNTHADETSENKRQTIANGLSIQKINSESAIRLADNRPGVIAQKKVQELIKNSHNEQHLRVSKEIVDDRSSIQKMPIQKIKNTIGVLQKAHKDIPAPNKDQVLYMDLLNQRNHRIVKEYRMERKGTHGTNWIHAISIMNGIEAQVPKKMRTSDVTPDEGGFFVDISESGKEHSHDFAKMAAYGTPVKSESTSTPTSKSLKEDDKNRDAFLAHVDSGKGKRKAMVLEIWGQKNAIPEPRKKGQLSNEDIYRANARLLVATLKDSL